MRVSRRMPQNLVLGCDQTLSLETGEMLDKAENRKDAERILRLLSGKTHYLHSAAVISLAGEPLWRHVERVKMTVRPLSDAFMESYLDAHWTDCLWCHGCYRIQWTGAHLYAGEEGRHVAGQVLPLVTMHGNHLIGGGAMSRCVQVRGT